MPPSPAASAHNPVHAGSSWHASRRNIEMQLRCRVIDTLRRRDDSRTDSSRSQEDSFREPRDWASERDVGSDSQAIPVLVWQKVLRATLRRNTRRAGLIQPETERAHLPTPQKERAASRDSAQFPPGDSVSGEAEPPRRKRWTGHREAIAIVG